MFKELIFFVLLIRLSWYLIRFFYTRYVKVQKNVQNALVCGNGQECQIIIDELVERGAKVYYSGQLDIKCNENCILIENRYDASIFSQISGIPIDSMFLCSYDENKSKNIDMEDSDIVQDIKDNVSGFIFMIKGFVKQSSTKKSISVANCMNRKYSSFIEQFVHHIQIEGKFNNTTIQLVNTHKKTKPKDIAYSMLNSLGTNYDIDVGFRMPFYRLLKWFAPFNYYIE